MTIYICMHTYIHNIYSLYFLFQYKSIHAFFFLAIVGVRNMIAVNNKLEWELMRFIDPCSETCELDSWFYSPTHELCNTEYYFLAPHHTTGRHYHIHLLVLHALEVAFNELIKNLLCPNWSFESLQYVYLDSGDFNFSKCRVSLVSYLFHIHQKISFSRYKFLLWGTHNKSEV